ncbi:aldehyde dehydrogenase family protein [Persicobacter diffluens]|uniref:NAD-dependent succinate-semialdehyde dehydrogenase n=1 Tax=Persicobacter diffluens TaxID=981 RepID=A0AAN4W490_9BACT|nr:NAD-dependent succinate-semialdehyde dehydrogenase [Persicobacter diffluens]
MQATTQPSAASLKYAHKNLYINGELVPATGGATYQLLSPATEEPIATISWAQKSDTEATLQAAKEGFAYWSKLPVAERVEWMLKLRTRILERGDELRTAIMDEMGKTWEGSEEDLVSITNALQFYADEISSRKSFEIADKEGTHQHEIVSQPLGVVVAFLAYNFPLLNMGFKLGPALAAGCSIIMKPSESSAISACLIGEIAHEIGFPKGVINVLCGNRQNVGIPLCESKIPQLITMIGSTRTAQNLIVQSSQTSIKRFSMECGGNAPFIVFEDADMDEALAIGGGVKFGNSGQICVAPNRFYIHKSRFDAFVEGMVAKAQSMKVGHGRENQPDMGPLANKASVESVHAIVEQAVAEGGKILHGGAPLEGPGYYYPPTVIVLDNPEAAVLQNEIFGPVALICAFETKEEVIKYANSVDAGLASYVFTEDEALQQEMAMALEFGEVQINGVKYDIYLPHIGVKDAGISMDCSFMALDDYLQKKRITKKL